MQDKVVFSAAQPTGCIHLGNLLGAICLWEELQSRYKRKFFCIADLHSLDSGKGGLGESSLDMACMYIACGINPHDSHIFVQSHVPQHSELFWLLSSLTSMGWLNKMTQYKEKSAARGNAPILSLYSYPVLMAADVLLYDAEIIPVGADQTQHVELIRDIASRFNQLYGQCFNLPTVLKKDSATRIMSLRDPLKKMSKSDPSDLSRINLLDSKELIEKKISSARTDAILGFSPEGIQDRYEAFNLLNIAASLSGKTIEELCKEVQSFSELKAMLIELLLGKLLPIQEKMKNLERTAVKRILADSAEFAMGMASMKVTRVRQLMGFL